MTSLVVKPFTSSFTWKFRRWKLIETLKQPQWSQGTAKTRRCSVLHRKATRELNKLYSVRSRDKYKPRPQNPEARLVQLWRISLFYTIVFYWSKVRSHQCDADNEVISLCMYTGYPWPRLTYLEEVTQISKVLIRSQEAPGQTGKNVLRYHVEMCHETILVLNEIKNCINKPVLFQAIF